MSTILPAKQQFENAPAGSHLGICYAVVDLGTQKFKSQMYGDEVCPGILFMYEIPYEKMQDGRPFAINQRLKLKSGKNATYRKFLESWRGVPFADTDFGTFDAKRVLGKPAMLQIKHETSEKGTYANISTIMQPMKGTTIPEIQNELLHFTFDQFEQAIYDKLPEWVRALIALSPEYQEIKGVGKNLPPSDTANGAPQQLDDEIPF